MALTDARLAQLARERENLRLQIAELETQKEIRDKKILRELNRRNTKSIETNGVKITAAHNSNTYYDFDGLMAEIGRPLARRVQAHTVDKKKLSELVQAGRIDGAVVARYTSVVPSSEYVRVS